MKAMHTAAQDVQILFDFSALDGEYSQELQVPDVKEFDLDLGSLTGNVGVREGVS